MYHAYVAKRIGVVREKLAQGAPGAESGLLQAENLLQSIETERFCFRIEPWHALSTQTRPEQDDISELLFHALSGQTPAFNLQWAIETIYTCGASAAFDALIVALAAQQAEAQKIFPVAINISPASACSTDFWTDVAPILDRYAPGNFVFELLEEEYIAPEEDRAALAAAAAKGYRFALDDVENNARDAARLEAYGPYAQFIKIDGSLIESWEMGCPGLHSFLAQLRRTVSGAAFIAEWVTSVPKARFLAEMGFNAVQGRCLPLDRLEFSRLYAQTPVHYLKRHGMLAGSFAALSQKNASMA